MLRFPGTVACLLFTFSVFLTSPAQASDTVRLTTGHWPPYFDESADDNGLLAELITQAYATQGLKTEFTFYPWSRALMLAKAGQFDGTAAWSCVEQRAHNFLYSAGVLPYQYVFYHRHTLQFDWASVEDLEGMSVGATQDYSYNKKLASLVGRGTVSVDVTTSDEANFRKLLAGRIDLFPMDPLVGMAMIDQWMTPEEAKELTFAPKPFKSSYYHVLFGHKNPRSNILRYRLNEGLRALWASGEFQEIVEKWLATEAPSDNTLDLKLFRPRFDGC